MRRNYCCGGSHYCKHETQFPCKGIDTIDTFDVTQELCFEFQNFSKLHQDEATIIFETAKS